MSAPSSATLRGGLWAAVAAFTLWGLSPLYFRALGALPSSDVVAHRVIWSVVLLLVLARCWRPAARTLEVLPRLWREPRLAGVLLATTLLASSNWLMVVWAIHNNRLIEASLGYFINPLVNVLLGRVFLGERLRRGQQIAVALAAVGVLWRMIDVGELPWIALFLAITFGVYGLLRKQAPVEAIPGLFAEMLFALPVALAWLWMQGGVGALAHLPQGTLWLLPVAGFITAVPLMLFATGARRLPLSTLGFIQYIAPSLSFMLAVCVFDEPFGAAQLMSFALIWSALALYSVDMIRASGGRPG